MTLAVHHFPVEASTHLPVLLLHGFASSGTEDFVANGFVEALTSTGIPAIVVDLPGHGGSPAIESPAEVHTTQVVAQILEAVDTVSPGDFNVIGYSLGARLAWELPAASTRVQRLVLGGVSPFEPFSMVDPAALAATLAGEVPAHPLVGMMAAMISAPGRDTASLAKLIEGLAAEPFSPATGGPQVPSLFIAGNEDQMTQGVESLLEGLPHAGLTRVPGDHRGALDNPELREAAAAFLLA